LNAIRLNFTSKLQASFLLVIFILAHSAAAEVTFEQACEQFNRYQFGNRIDRLIEQHGQEAFDRRTSMLCSCYETVLVDAGYQAASTLTRIVEEDAFFADPPPPWFLEFDERTRDQFQACNATASGPDPGS